MSHDLTHEQVVGAPKVRSSSKLAAINAIAAMANETPRPTPRLALHVSELRDAIADGENTGALTPAQVQSLTATLEALERAHPGATLLPLDAAERPDLEQAATAYLERQRAGLLERGDSATWPVCAPGPCAAGPFGLVLPNTVPSRADAEALLAQLVSTHGLRELTSREREALRSLRRQGIRQPSAPEEFVAIAKATLRRRSKAAKRARHAQRMMEGNRAAAERLANVDGAEVAC